MKKLFVISLIFLLILSVFSLAHGEETFSQAEDIIKDKVPCEDLSDEQLESLGDYYMEQMHPGESHTSMDEMMGGEGSESLRQVHISMARNFYCGEHQGTSGIMGSMMSGGMMSSNGGQILQNQGGMGQMMNGNFMGTGWLWWIFMVLIWGLIIAGIVFVILWAYQRLTSQKKPRINALEILKCRFAKGEITKKQFEKMRKEIR
ncbi:hypothetical protein HOI26_04025 [Candidatus Woesearchaeota archaeon]|jgi:putative membrane protein|nr:hypothetical protein [Candidatus Woesearchaeota archaeon]MBT5740244.1 hypothetical protein [Candidatus Woesearchaeota archaeon]